jgi:hypothetical protein
MSADLPHLASFLKVGKSRRDFLLGRHILGFINLMK